MAGFANKAANPNAKKAASNYGRAVSTMTRWSLGQGSPLRDLTTYIAEAQHPHRLAAAVLRAADEGSIKAMSTRDLMDEMTWPQSDPSEWTWLELALEAEATAASALYQSAVLVEMSKRRLSVSDVLMRRWSNGRSRLIR